VNGKEEAREFRNMNGANVGRDPPFGRREVWRKVPTCRRRRLPPVLSRSTCLMLLVMITSVLRGWFR
jgi:hypothetical protein